MRTSMIAVLSVAFATGCAMQTGSPDERFGPDGQPLGANNDAVGSLQTTGVAGPTTASIRDCNSPDPQPWNCANVRPNSGSATGPGTTRPHDVYGNTGSDKPDQAR